LRSVQLISRPGAPRRHTFAFLLLTFAFAKRTLRAMSDTFQAVHWSLGGVTHPSGHFFLHDWREPREDVLWASIRQLGLERAMRSAFQITKPLWYGLWIDSPLTLTQCSLLRELFAEVARRVPAYAKYIEEFTRALAHSIGSREPMHVGLDPPGHVDMGWVTTFVHCPRCKAEGPVERWQETYSEQPLACPVCGHIYSPAATHKMERELFAETVSCRSCGAVNRVRDFSDNAIQLLEDRHNFDGFSEEMSWLRRVEDFYRRHPELEGKIKPHVFEVLESRDPEVREAMIAGAPFDEIELPANAALSLHRSRDWSPEDEEVAQYLKHHHFSLEARKEFVAEAIERLGRPLFQSSPVKCRSCGGDLA
jgi:hypothetical protein